jgi:hypothetical protein
VALAHLSAALVHADRTVEGMALLDESLAAVAGNDVEDFFILEDIFCQLFSAREHACDVRRADESIRVGEAIAAGRKLPAVSAFCRNHYGGVLTTAGRWSEAEATLTDAGPRRHRGRRRGGRRSPHGETSPSPPDSRTTWATTGHDRLRVLGVPLPDGVVGLRR